MNHDYAHCSDFTEKCPKSCFRAQLVRDLEAGMSVSFMHLKDTSECPLTAKKKRTVQIVIDIPKDFYERVNEDGCMSYTDAEVVVNAFYCGKVLPKGHGRIVDIDDAVKDMDSFFKSFCVFYASGYEPNVDYTGDVLIEADKEEE